MKKIILIVLITITVLLGIGLFFKKDGVEFNQEQPRLQIVTSFYPLYFFTSRIVEDKALVTNLTANGDPHDFEPTTGDLRLIDSADLLVSNGVGVESWIETLESQTPILLSALNLADIEHDHEDHEGEEHEEEADHDHGPLDPHIWLDPTLASQQVQVIANAISELDEENRNFYQNNALKLIQELEQLDREFSSSLQSCQQDHVITAHAAFAYMARRYDFEQLSIQGLNHEEEIGAKQLSELAKLAKDKQIKYIFFENLLSPKLAQTLAQEVDASILLFDPLESIGAEDLNNGADYFSIQRQNLANLKLALECAN